MTTPYASFNTTPSTPSGTNAAPNYFMTPTPPPTRGRPRGSAPGTGAKRGRKPRGGSTLGTNSPRIPQGGLTNVSSTQTGTSSNYVHWAVPSGTGPGEGSTAGGSGGTILQGGVSASPGQSPAIGGAAGSGGQQLRDGASSAAAISGTSSLPTGTPLLDMSKLISFPGAAMLSGVPALANTRPGQAPAEEDGEGDDELLPAMADDDYSAQLSWQSQSKDNLKVLMDNFSPGQYDRFESYRRHALPKQAVRKVIQQTLGYQVSQPVAQIIAGFSKVFVGEIVEQAREIQMRRGETGPLSPDHLREAYRAYQQETGRVGAARPLRAKKLFVR